MRFDHVAFQSSDIVNTVNWYISNLDAEVLYQDSTWAFLSVGGTKIAFVTPGQHPPHICFSVDDNYIREKLKNKIFKSHRDGSESCYIRDVDGNHIEFLKWPKKNG